jgi:flagellar basal body-associated protein FliL
MEDRKKNENRLDAGAASMAYMPTPDGQSDDKELKIDKSAEKHTMADIAAELEAEDQAAAIKVPVGGKPVAVASTKAAPKAAAKPKADPKPTEADLDDMPLVVHDGTAPTEFDNELDDMDESEVHTDTVSKPAKSGGGKKVLVGLVLVSLVAAVVFGYLWWNQKSTVASLNDKVSNLESSQTTLKKELEDAAASTPVTTDEATPTPVVTGSTRSIPEVALTYKLTDNTKKVTYSYSESTADGTVHSVLRFSSTELIGAERKVVSDPSKYTCNADSAPLGRLTSYRATDTVPQGGKASALKVDGKMIFKFGETYFIFTTSQSTCSADKTVQASQTAGNNLMPEFLSTLAR